ncbi:2-isopropylmalate synthase [Amycolatopsis pithecellobii]|nr:2-isopropylmalate synthase [Amycolatopsis pithecellobii]
MVLWEESARDGAQAKTLMSAAFRVSLARAQGRIFGENGPAHVVFAAGFPAICDEEFDATRRVAHEAADAVSPAAVCRGTVDDVRQACRAVAGAPQARVMIVVPSSDEIADAMVHQPAATALATVTDLVHAARDTAPEVAVDVCFADAPRAEVGLLADRAEAVTDAGAGVIVIADTIGDLLPDQTTRLFTELRAAVSDRVVLASHLHNDLGLGVANTIAAVRSGVRVAACSWLGMAERSGMVATEQLLFLLAHRADQLGLPAGLWPAPPDLTPLSAIAKAVSAETGVPLSVTTPIVGTGVGTISTGTPFVRPATFQPFDPELVGITPTVVLTHLASDRVVHAVAQRLGHDLHRGDTAAVRRWVKTQAYQRNDAVIPDVEFAGFLSTLRASR